MNPRTLLVPAFMLAASLLPAQHAGHHAEPEEPAKPAVPECCRPSAGADKGHELAASSLYQLDVTFTGDDGKPFALSELRGRPVVLAMFFASCTYACPMTVADITRIRDGLPADLRDKAALVMISFDTVRDTVPALRQFRQDRSLGNEWTLLRGDDDAVREIAALLGVKFKQEADGNFAHSNIISILDTEGRLAHQRIGLKGGLDEATAVLARVSR